MPIISTLDLVLLVLLGVGAYGGWRKGLVVELAFLVAYIIGLISAILLFDMTMAILEPMLGKSWIVSRVVFIGLIIGVAFAIKKMAYYIRSSMKSSALGEMDKWAGAGLGLLKMAFLISVGLAFLNLLGLKYEQMTGQSLGQEKAIKRLWVYPYVAPLAPKCVEALKPFFPLVGTLAKDVKKRFI